MQLLGCFIRWLALNFKDSENWGKCFCFYLWFALLTSSVGNLALLMCEIVFYIPAQLKLITFKHKNEIVTNPALDSGRAFICSQQSS